MGFALSVQIESCESGGRRRSQKENLLREYRARRYVQRAFISKWIGINENFFDSGVNGAGHVSDLGFQSWTQETHRDDLASGQYRTSAQLLSEGNVLALICALPLYNVDKRKAHTEMEG